MVISTKRAAISLVAAAIRMLSGSGCAHPEIEIVVTTLFQDGKDPDDSCNGPLTTTCEVLVPDGEYTVHFAGESIQIAFPLEPGTCLPSSLGTTG